MNKYGLAVNIMIFMLEYEKSSVLGSNFDLIIRPRFADFQDDIAITSCQSQSQVRGNMYSVM